jgi:hypothetical protein
MSSSDSEATEEEDSDAQGDVYTVECIVDRKGTGKGRRYLVKWEDYEEVDNTWEPAEHLHPALIAEYEGSVKRGSADQKEGVPASVCYLRQHAESQASSEERINNHGAEAGSGDAVTHVLDGI